jgi:hypothetical protein
MHDTRPGHLRQRGVEVQQGVLKRTVRVARGRMNHHARGFVEHQQGIIGMHNGQIQGLGDNIDLGFRFRVQGQGLPPGQPESGPLGSAIDRQRATFDPVLQPGA